MKKLSIVMPVFNEEKTVEETVARVENVRLDRIKKEIIIINDASSDKTAQVLGELQEKFHDLRIITHKENRGKGAAVRTGFEAGTGDYFVIQDADLEYDPKYLQTLIKPIMDGEAEVVYGTRLHRLPNLKKEERTARFLLHYFGNRFLSLVTSVLYGQWVTDMETCYKVFPRVALEKIALHGSGFDFEPEITAKLMKQGYKIVEIPITTKPRGYEEGKKLQTFPEGLKAFWTLVKYRFSD